MKVLGNAAVFVILYLLFMGPTYFLPFIGSNSAIIGTLGAASHMGVNPAFWLHLGSLLVLVAVAWFRGSAIGKSWLVIFPILAAVFDLAPGLNFIFLVPTVMHLLAIILGVVGANAAIAEPRHSERSAGRDEYRAPASNADLPTADSYDANKWSALLKYDADVAAAADRIRPFGQRWIDELASSYLALNDKGYLKQIADKIHDAARLELEQRKRKPISLAKSTEHEDERERTRAAEQQEAFLPERERRLQHREERRLVWHDRLNKHRVALVASGITIVVAIGAAITVWVMHGRFEQKQVSAAERPANLEQTQPSRVERIAREQKASEDLAMAGRAQRDRDAYDAAARANTEAAFRQYLSNCYEIGCGYKPVVDSRLADLERQRGATETQAAPVLMVQSYFAYAGSGQVDAALACLDNPKPSSRRVLENLASAQLNELRLESMGADRAVVFLDWTGRARGAKTQRYRGTIPMILRGASWRIETFGQLHLVP